MSDPGLLVHDKVTDLPGSGHDRPRTAQQRPHAGEQLGHREGLGEIVIGTGVEPGQAVAHRIRRGQKQDRRVRVGPQRPRD